MVEPSTVIGSRPSTVTVVGPQLVPPERPSFHETSTEPVDPSALEPTCFSVIPVAGSGLPCGVAFAGRDHSACFSAPFRATIDTV